MYQGKPVSLEIITPSPVDGQEYAIGNVLKTELNKVGVPTTLRSLSGSVHDEKFQRGEFDIDSSWAGVAFDPEQMYTDWESSKAKKIGTNAVDKNKSRFRDPTLDVLSKQLSQIDPTSPRGQAAAGPGTGDLLPEAAAHPDHPDRLPVVLQHYVLDRLADRRRSLPGAAELVVPLLVRRRQAQADRSEGPEVTAAPAVERTAEASAGAPPRGGLRAWLSAHPLASYAIRRFGCTWSSCGAR